jgi:5-methylcytosine-specific restriction endonuclease McrA
MSQSRVPKALRKRVAEQARHRCGYCLSREAVTGLEMEIEHLCSEAQGGATEEDNLWLACGACNKAKNAKDSGYDPVTDEMVPLFHPRRDRWQDHFRWSEEGDLILGLTPTGRATVTALRLNRLVLVEARKLWVLTGLHPPKD